MFVENLSIICPFAQIVRGRSRRRLVAPRPGGDFFAPGKNGNHEEDSRMQCSYGVWYFKKYVKKSRKKYKKKKATKFT
jgi:hypothetical protein